MLCLIAKIHGAEASLHEPRCNCFHGERALYAKNQHLVWSYDESSWVFMIADGLARVHFSASGGAERLIAYLVPGMVFAKKESLQGATDNTLPYTAEVPSTLYCLKRADFLGLLDSEPAFAREHTQAIGDK